MNHKVRQSVGKGPASRRVAGGRPALAKSEVKPVETKAWGADRTQYPRVPDELWNWLGSVYAQGFRGMAKMLNEAYEQGVASNLVSLLENKIPEAVFALGRAVDEGLLQQERGFHGSCLKDSAGQSLQYEGDRSRTILTRLGHVTVRRAYYRGDGDTDNLSLYPLDVLLGIDGIHGMMPSVQEALALLGSKTSYPDAVSIVQALMPFPVSLRTVERVTHSVAQELVEFQVEDKSKAQSRGSISSSALATLPIAVLAVDGGMCRMRAADEQFREFKMGVFGQLSGKAGDDINGKLYFAHFGSADILFDYLSTSYFKEGLDKAKLLHVVSDGAAWIWNRVGELKQEGQSLSCVLDFYHAKERLANLTSQLFGTGTEKSASELAGLIDWLLSGCLDLFFAKLQSWKQQDDPTLKELVRGDLGYFENHKTLLRYAECRAANLPIGSGVIEGAIRFVGKDRLDRTGMRWSEAGAELVLQLRCTDASARWKTFSERRAKARQQKYFAARKRWNLAA
jgi:hypothetical protein